jgi:hypothetical protein
MSMFYFESLQRIAYLVMNIKQCRAYTPVVMADIAKELE